MASTSITPEINYNVILEIDISDAPHTEPEWADMGIFTKNVAQALNEVIYQATYYADQGWASDQHRDK